MASLVRPLVPSALLLLSALGPAAAARVSPAFRHEQTAYADRESLRDLIHEDGRLSFSQLKSEVSVEQLSKMATGKPLYPVSINMDVESMDAGGGLSMMFDKQNHRIQVETGIKPVDGLAWGFYKDNIAASGWSELYMFTTNSDSVANDVKMYAVGWLEGLMTAVRLSQFHANYHVQLLRGEQTWGALQAIKNEIAATVGFMAMKCNLGPHVMSEEPGSKYWKLARYMTFQMWGIQEGFNHVAKHFNVHTLSMVDLLFLNYGGEIATDMMAFSPLYLSERRVAQAFLQLGSFIKKSKNKRHVAKKVHEALHRHPVVQKAAQARQSSGLRGFTDPMNISTVIQPGPEGVLGDMMAKKDTDLLDDQHWEARMAYEGHCSALVRVSGGNADLYTAHNTWGDYSSMTRIFKYYVFPLAGTDQMAVNTGFSSYPGAISSMDDFYILGSGLVVMDSTLELLSETIWDKVVDNAVSLTSMLPNFMHIQITNRMAKTPQHWVNLLTTRNNGNYNVQWMITDYNNFVPGQQVSDNVFWVLEVVPGIMHSEDMSHRLRSHGYWPAMNRPFFADIRKPTGFKRAQGLKGNLYSWQDNPRALIFKAAQGANSLFDIRNLIYRNNYPKAGVDPNTPGHEISARFDLSPSGPFPNGGIDAKITSKCLMGAAMSVQAASGPVHVLVPPFAWVEGGKEKWPGYSHIGQPDVWNFGWVTISMNGEGGIVDCR